VRTTPFSKILTAYCAAIFLFLLWPASTRTVAHSAQAAVRFVCRALRMEPTHAMAMPNRLLNAGGSVGGGLTHDDDIDMPVRNHETIRKSFTLPPGHRSLEIDNIFGSIEVVGEASDQVELVIEKNTRAESKDALALAAKEVTLDVTQELGALKLYVNGPFRCHCDDDCRNRRDHEGYVVKMDFQVRVPRDIDTKVKTVNEGRVVVRDVTGNFLARNVNGDIEMDRLAGAGTAHTVNGPVKVHFRENPRDSSGFQTVNGNVELFFMHGLSADFRFKTFNGGLYSDFPVTALPAHAMREDHRGGKTIFRADRYTEARVSSGGPQIQVENLNGDIRILENHE
jgi:hypothetical protein